MHWIQGQANMVVNKVGGICMLVQRGQRKLLRSHTTSSHFTEFASSFLFDGVFQLMQCFTTTLTEYCRLLWHIGFLVKRQNAIYITENCRQTLAS